MHPGFRQSFKHCKDEITTGLFGSKAWQEAEMIPKHRAGEAEGAVRSCSTPPSHPIIPS